MGLNESYMPTRSQILLINPLPSVSQAYSMVISDESQKSVTSNSSILGANPAIGQNLYDNVMHTRSGVQGSGYIALYSRNGGNPKFKKNYNLQCEFCKLKGYTRETCYKLVGYPAYFKFKKRIRANTGYNGGNNTGYNGNNSSTAHNVCYESSTYGSHMMHGQMQGVENQVVYTQGSQGSGQGIGIISSSLTTENNNELTITTALAATESNKEWIVDTGDTNHMLSDINLLDKSSINKPEISKKGFLPNGDISLVTHIGASKLTESSTITNVFYLPQFKFNLLISTLVKGIGRQEGGLYILPSHQAHICSLVTNNLNSAFVSISQADISLWHKRFGHVSFTVLKKILQFLTYVKTQFDKVVKIVKTDNGTEFVNSVCSNLFKTLGLIHQRSCAYYPQQNGVAERKHRHILEVTRAIRF
ncbi:uncharacterized protein LOC132630283 [Lycium barbarum]|uniref:uncharacterized protein LOC132630283 n=1 Tax=Lycium barbarum TaxID=112863 RepID=UPI00293F04B3|nr:uncharacterized protein LOC132630283 [Lycium barbarum]